MSSYNFTPVGFLVLQCFSYVIIITTFFFRIWVLQELAYKRSFQLATLAHLMFVAFMLGTLGFCTGFSVAELKAMHHLEDEQAIEDAVMTRSLSKGLFVTGIFYTSAIWALKVAFLGYFYGFQRHLTRRLQIFLHGTSVFVAVTYVVVMLLLFTLCRPLKHNWSVKAEYRCVAVEKTPLIQIHLATNIFSDLMLISIPILTVRSLKLPKSEKYAIAIILAIGVVAPAMAVNRFVIMWEILGGIGADQFRTRLSCSLLEALLANVAFFLPAVRVYYRRLLDDGGLGSLFSSRTRSEGIHVSKTVTVKYGSRGENASDTELAQWKPTWETETGTS